MTELLSKAEKDSVLSMFKEIVDAGEVQPSDEFPSPKFAEPDPSIAYEVLQSLDRLVEFSEEPRSGLAYEVLCAIDGELEFAAAKKSGKGKGGANKKDCKKGVSCGGSCISKKKACVKEMSASQKKKYNALLKKVKAGGGGGGEEAQQQIDKIIADQVAAKTGQQPEAVPVVKARTQKELADDAGDFLLSGAKTNDDFFLTPSQPAQLNLNGSIFDTGGQSETLSLFDSVKGSSDKAASKIQRMMNESLTMTEIEARAIATWISDEQYSVNGADYSRYSLMNRAKYAPDTLPPDVLTKVEAVNRLAESGYQKLDRITIDGINQRATTAFDPDVPLSRFVSFSDGIIQQYKDSIGKEVTEKIHFATTHKKKLDWVEDKSNVQFKVTPKYDGTGNGRYLDHFKNGHVEGEIMFPPGTKFRVDRVTDGVSEKPEPAFFVTTKAEKSILKTKDTDKADELWAAKTNAGLYAEGLAGMNPAKAKAQWESNMDGASSMAGVSSYIKDFYQELKKQPIDQVLKYADQYKAYFDSLTMPKSPTIIELTEV